MTLRHLDLFSGIGGFTLAAQWAGFETVAFAEIDPFCTQVLKKHWPKIKNFGDVRNVPKLDSIDLMTGGFPCQPFSQAGKKKGNSDARYLWPEFYRLIMSMRPTWVVAENVNGIVDMELDNILDDLEVAGYETQSFIIPASAVQAPHRRERLWIVAHALRERCDFRFDCSNFGQLQIDWERDFKALQEKWKGFFPDTWQTFNIQNWLGLASYSDGEQCNTQSADTVAVSKRPQWAFDLGKASESSPASCREENKPPIPGVDDGLPNIVDRNKSLGNAIVPQVVYPILKAIVMIGERQHV